MSETDSKWTDPDTASVIEILEGAYRGPNDPDLAITNAIARLSEDDDPVAYNLVLEQLIRDAHSD